MPIQFSESLNQEDIDFLTQKINEETPSFGEAHPFAFFIKDENNNIIAGCNGSIIYNVIHTDQLWVHPNHRNQHLASNLMQAVHSYAIKKSCKLATVCTMSFQNAQSFYQKQGYSPDFQRPGYSNNSSLIFLKKELYQT